MTYSNNKSLAKLSAAAMALPGMFPQGVNAQDAMQTEQTFHYRYSSYKEAPIAAEFTIDGNSVERYEIDVHQLRFRSPITDATEIAIDAMVESMSGASPRYVVPLTDDDELKPIQVMSGATIDEKRNDIDVSFTTFHNSSISNTGISYSKENDYSSFGLRTKYAWFFNEKNTSFELGASASQDFIDATPNELALPGDPSRVTGEEKNSLSVSLGLSQVLSQTSVLSSSFNFARYSGYMSDPYKEVWVIDINDTVADTRPDLKEQWAISNQFRKYFEKAGGALHIDYRFFQSNWETSSHTVELRWVHAWESGWQLSPSVRFYDQSEAAFFRNWYEFQRSDGYLSSDYRLSAYTAVSAKLRLMKRFSYGALVFSFEDYSSEAKENTAMMASPSLVSFSHLSVGFDIRF